MEETIKKDKNATNYKPKNFDVNRPGIGVTVEHVTSKSGKGKNRKFVNVNQHEKQQVSNYDLLERLGFSKNLIGENKKLGLKERTMQDLNSYVI